MFNESWLNFFKEIAQAKKDLGFEKNEECFYRGHSSVDHKLVPGLFRDVAPKSKKISEALWDIESSMFYEFRSRAKEIHQGNLTDWDILFYMQHHGVKTRLLDWTENLGVAFYFSLLGKGNENFSPCIWLLNPYRLNWKYHKSADLFSPENLAIWNKKEEEYNSYADLLLDTDTSHIFWWNEPVALYPIRNVDRLASQGGYFTIHGNDIRAIEEIIVKENNIWKQIVIPLDAIEDCKLFLEQAGINEFTMFPDLDGLAKYLNRKNFNY